VNHVAVLVSTRTDPVSGRATRSTADAAAVAMAQALGAEPTLYAAGEMSDAVARDYLALGVPALHRIGGDAEHVVAALAQAASGASLILTGARAQGGLGSGLLPYQLAQALGRPLVPDVIAIEADGAAWIVRQALPRGARRRLRVTVPAVLVIGERAPPATRYAWDAAQRGSIVALAAPKVAASTFAAVDWHFEPARKQLRPLAAQVQQSGHARMAGAVGTAAATTSSRVIKDGSVQDKAQALLDHLRSVGLVA
jgi:electron transfer flavoprotein beta subunit